MKTIIALLFCVVIGSSPMSAIAQKNDLSTFMQTASALLIEPAYAELTLKTQALYEQILQSCVDDLLVGDELAQAQSAWFDSMDALARVQMLIMPPISDGLAHYRFHHWPHVRQKFFVKRMNTLMNTAELTQEYVQNHLIVQGLPAIEWMLFEPIDKEKLCFPLIKVSLELTKNTQPLVQKWQQVSASLSDERSAKFRAGLLLDAFIAHLEIMARYSIREPVNGSKPSALLAFRSGYSTAMLKSSFRVLSSVFVEPSAYSIKPLIQQSDNPDALREIERLLASVSSSLIAVSDLSDSLSEPTQKAIWLTIASDLSLLHKAIKASVGPALGLNLTEFNASDGD